jgi:hypothetical protein
MVERRGLVIFLSEATVFVSLWLVAGWIWAVSALVLIGFLTWAVLWAQTRRR